MEANQLLADDAWLADHLDEMVDRYAGRVIAIQHGAIVTIGDSEAEVYRLVQGQEPMPLVFRVPRLEDLQSILAHAHCLPLINSSPDPGLSTLS
jgi:hypothetical protein